MEGRKQAKLGGSADENLSTTSRLDYVLLLAAI
jgi:hypothetical protein